MAASNLLTDRFLHYLFSNQLLLIEILFAVIIGLCVIWLFFNLQTEAKQSESSRQLRDIEKALERVLATAKPVIMAGQAAAVEALAGTPASVPAQGASAVVGSEDIAKLKAENEAKAQKLAELEKAFGEAKEQLSKVQTQAAGANTDEIQKKIKDLEARLAEYEIIEDDIANLSLYKEENIRLKNELQKSKSGLTPTPGADAPPAPKPDLASKQAAEPVAAPSAPAPAPLEEVAAAETVPAEKEINPDKLVSEVAEIAAAPVPPVAVASTEENKDNGEKLIEEFESFMKDASKP